ncbi:MAG: heavy metal-binding domain-containing protein [Bacteroidota bacterium]
MKIKTILAILTVGFMLAFAACNSKAPKEEQKPAQADTSKVAMGKYKCPMCADVAQDSAGKCPKCGMELEKKQ